MAQEREWSAVPFSRLYVVDIYIMKILLYIYVYRMGLTSRL